MEDKQTLGGYSRQAKYTADSRRAVRIGFVLFAPVDLFERRFMKWRD